MKLDCKISKSVYCLVYFAKLISLFLLKHFSNAGFPCPIMQSPSDHFLRAINTDFDRIIAMCKNWQVLAFCSCSWMTSLHLLLVIDGSGMILCPVEIRPLWFGMICVWEDEQCLAVFSVLIPLIQQLYSIFVWEKLKFWHAVIFSLCLNIMCMVGRMTMAISLQ